MNLHIVQKYRPEDGQFEIDGVFTSSQEAKRQCTTINHCYNQVPIILGQSYSDKTYDMGYVYPIAEGE